MKIMKTLRELALSCVADNIQVGIHSLPPVLQEECLELMEERRKEWTDASFAALLELTCDETVST